MSVMPAPLGPGPMVLTVLSNVAQSAHPFSRGGFPFTTRDGNIGHPMLGNRHRRRAMGSQPHSKTGLNLTFRRGLIPSFPPVSAPFRALIPAQECQI